MTIKPENVLVTGGTGFLGYRLALRLQSLGHTVTATGRNLNQGNQLTAAGIRFIPADLRDARAMRDVCRGQACVYHCGALSSPWGRYQNFWETNVRGTQHVVDGCCAQGVPRLIHVSSASLYFEYQDKFNLREQDPLPIKKVNAYAQTKFLAEQVIEQGLRAGLPAVILRPCGIFGPGDTSLLPRLVAANNRAFLPVLGGKQVLVDITYVDNLVDAMLLCREKFDQVAGKKYNITNGEPRPLHPMLADLITRLEFHYRTRTIPFALAYGLAALLEGYAKTLGRYREPRLTRYSVGVLTFSRTLDISAAQTDLGYQPRIAIDQGITEVIRNWPGAAGHAH